MRWLRAVPSTFLTKHATFLSLIVGVNLPGTHKPLIPSCQLPLAVMCLLPPLIVVSALLGACNTTGSLPSTGSSEPEADEAADPASTLLQVADPATPLLVALGFPSKPPITLLDHAERGVGRCGGRCMGRCRGVSLSSRPQRGSTEKEPEEPERTKNTKNEHENKSRYLLGGIQCTRYLFGGIQYRRYLLGDIQCRRYLLCGIQCWRYLLGGFENWRYSFGGIESWRYFWAVSRVGVTFLAKAVKSKYGGIFSAVLFRRYFIGGFRFSSLKLWR